VTKAPPRWLISALGPLFVISFLAVMIWRSETEERESFRDKPAPVTQLPSRSSSVEISTLPLDGSVPDWTASQGNFRLIEINGKTVLELGHEPLVEGRMVWTRLLGKTGTIRARMRGERTRRNSPRFAVGVAGKTAYWLRAVPLEGALQIVGKEEKMVASAPWEGTPERSLWLELKFNPNPGEDATCLEGRVWYDGEPRPGVATISANIADEFGFGRATVAGAPFALKPIYLEFLEVAP
jgi:hypothetical protein